MHNKCNNFKRHFPLLMMSYLVIFVTQLALNAHWCDSWFVLMQLLFVKAVCHVFMCWA